MALLAAFPELSQLRRFASLSAAHVAQLQTDGFAVVDGFLDAEWAGVLRAELLALLAQGLLQPNQIQLATSKGPVRRFWWWPSSQTISPAPKSKRDEGGGCLEGGERRPPL